MFKCMTCQADIPGPAFIEGISVYMCKICEKKLKCSKCNCLTCKCFMREIFVKKLHIEVITKDIEEEKLRISKLKTRPSDKFVNLRLDDLIAEKERTQAEIDKFEKIRHQRRQSQKALTGINFEAFLHSLNN